MYSTPSSLLPKNSSTTEHFLSAMPEINTLYSGFATIQYSESTFALTYSSSGLAITPRFMGIVQGVVVHIIRNSFSLPFILNLRNTDLSFTSLYSSSCFASAVSQLAHHLIVLRPS